MMNTFTYMCNTLIAQNANKVLVHIHKSHKN